MAGFANPILYLFDDDAEGMPLVVKNRLPYDPLKNCTDEELAAMAPGAIQFSHSLETQIGGQLKAGLVLTHLFEDHHHEGELAKYLPTFIATRAIKP